MLTVMIGERLYVQDIICLRHNLNFLLRCASGAQSGAGNK